MSQAASVDSAQGGVDRSSGFVRELGLLDSTMIVAGSMIGSGIFIVPATSPARWARPAGS